MEATSQIHVTQPTFRESQPRAQTGGIRLDAIDGVQRGALLAGVSAANKTVSCVSSTAATVAVKPACTLG